MSFSETIKTVPVIGMVYRYIEDLFRFSKDMDYIATKAEYKAEQTMFWDQIARNIATDHIKIDHKEIELGTTKVRVLIVGQSQGTSEGFHPEKAFRMMKKIRDINVPNAAVDITMSGVPIPTMETHEMLRGASFFNQKNQTEFVKNNELGKEDREINNVQADINRCIDLVHEGKEKMFYGNYIVTIFAETEKAMDDAYGLAKGALLGSDILAIYPEDRMWEGFMSGQMYPWLEDFTAIRWFSTFMALISPTVSAYSQLTKENEGVYLGDEIMPSGALGKEVFWNYSKLAAQNMLIAGGSGNGKTYTIIDILIQLYIFGRRCWYITKKIDDNTDYKNVAQNLKKSATIELGQDLDKKWINPFHIFYGKHMRDISEHHAQQIYNNKKIFLSRYIEAYLKKEYNHRMDNSMDKWFDKLYEKYKISKFEPHTWHKAKFPVLGDLVDFMEEALKTMKGDDKRTCASMLAKLYVFKHGGRYDFVNRQTDADINIHDTDFGIIEYERIPVDLQESTNIILSEILSWQTADADHEGFTIAIDEGGAFLRDETLASQMFEGVTQYRSRKGQLLFSFHEADDVRQAGMSEVMKTNCNTKLMFCGGVGTDITLQNSIMEFMGLPENYRRTIAKMQKHQCIMRIDNMIGAVEIVAPDDVDKMLHGQKLEDFDDIPEEDVKVPEPELIIKPKYEELVEKNKYLLESWLAKFTDHALKEAGYIPRTYQRAADNGRFRTWVKKEIIKKKKLEDGQEIEIWDNGILPKKEKEKEKEYLDFQLPEHYSSNVQYGGILLDLKLEGVKVNHHYSVDAEGIYKSKKIAIEFEMGGTHTIEQISDKNLRARSYYDYVVFVYTGESKSIVLQAVGDWEKGEGWGVPRGTKVMNCLEAIIKEIDDLPENQEQKPDENEDKKAPEKASTDELLGGSDPDEKIDSEPTLDDVKGEFTQWVVKVDKTEMAGLMENIIMVTEDDVVGEHLYGIQQFLSPETVMKCDNDVQLKLYKRLLAVTFLREHPEEAKGLYEQATEHLKKLC